MSSSSLTLLNDEQVIEMRKLVLSGDSPGDRYFADKFGVNTNVIGKAIRGKTFKHLNEIAPPTRRTVKKVDLEQKSRELYMSGMTYNQIVEELKVSKASVSKWCNDLAKVRLQKEIDQRSKIREEKRKQRILEVEKKYEENRALKRSGIRNRTQRLRNGLQVLSVDDVVHMRRQIRIDGMRNLAKWSAKFGVGISSISFAISGRTFKEADAIEPPVRERLALPIKSLSGERKYKPDENLVQEALSLRKENPYVWTYSALAKRLSEQTGRNYQGTHIAKLLRNRDPSIIELEQIKIPRVRKVRIPKPPKPPKPKKEKPVYHTLECVICEKEFLSKDPEVEICSRKRCHKVLESYNDR